MNKLAHIIVFLVINNLAFSQIVTNITQLNNAISAATPGTIIELADGTWNDVFIDIDKNGTSSDPITITAQNPGAVFITGNSGIYMEGSYLTVSGLIFQNASNLVVNSGRIDPIIELNECDYCKVLNNKIDSYNGTEIQKDAIFKWVYLDDCQYNEIAYNSFIGKYGLGSIINDNRQLSNPDYLQIHHNYFADRTPINGITDDNDQDAIRIGTSTTSLSNSFSEVYDNYFYNFFGEIEVISNKSGENKYYNNTFRDYGGCLTLRHGDNCEVYGNYFFAEDNFFSGGVRVIGEGHKVYNNYIEGINSFKPSGASSNVTGGINVMNGELGSPLNGYYQVKNAQIVNNTFVNCDYALRIGTVLGGNDQEPENLIIANNIMYNSSINAYQITTSPSGSSVSWGNLTNIANSDLSDDGNFHRLTIGSAPINAGIGTYSYLTKDILEGNRPSNFDAGAEEFGANGTSMPYTSSDVGVNIGFGAAAVSNPFLTVIPSTINFDIDTGFISFDIISNLNWTITENISWLSLDVTSGSGSTTIVATVTENNTGALRAGNISIDENIGGSNLSAVVDVIQSNTFVGSEIPIIGTSSQGMQINGTVAEINAYNDDYTNYWTGNPDTEVEVSITFDLKCIHELSEIGIYFWRADERTTTFSIEVADTVTGPFTLVIDSAVSDSFGVTVDTEQIFSLNGVFGRYVKFIGIGNSSSTNWTSIANVNIYGNPDCELDSIQSGINSISIFNPLLNIQSVNVFPTPTKNGFLTLFSSSKKIKTIHIYSMTGQLVLNAHGNDNYSKQLDVSKLIKGLYFIELEGLGSLKFIKD